MKENKQENKIIKIIAQQIGIEPQDIKLEDTLREDLHMDSQDLSELQNHLVEKGFDEEKIDLTEIQTVSDLIDLFTSEEEF